jgi:hypothetical protein
MRKDQIEYFKGRVTGIVRGRQKEIADKHTVPAVKLSDAGKASLIRSGKVKMRSGIVAISRYDHVCDVFDFSKHQSEAHLTPAGHRLMTTLNEEANSVLDAVILGEEAEAFRRLEAFAKANGSKK